MAEATLEAVEMAKKAASVGSDDEPIGPILAANFARLGYVETTVKVADIAAKVKGKNGKPMSRQRVTAILNAIRVSTDTIEKIAKGLGVKPAELLKKPPKKGGEK